MTEYVEIEYEILPDRPGGNVYRVLHDGEVIVETSPDPEFDAARAMLWLGADRDAILISYEVGDPKPRLYGRVGHMAQYTASGTRWQPRGKHRSKSEQDTN